MKVSINIEDGTSRLELVKAIREYESQNKCIVLKMYVSEEHTYTLVEFDGILVTMWYGNVDNFIRCDFSNLKVISTM